MRLSSRSRLLIVLVYLPHARTLQTPPLPGLVATSQTLLGPSTKSVFQITRPLIPDGYVDDDDEVAAPTKKPTLLYLPGFDGTLVAPFLQFPELSTSFDVLGLSVGVDDRSTFDDLASAMCDFIRQQQQQQEDEDADSGSGGLYLIGESFGGLLACDQSSSDNPCAPQEEACFGENACADLVANMDPSNPDCQGNVNCEDLVSCAFTCMPEEDACFASPACAAILMNSGNAPPVCGGNAECDALMTCAMASTGSPCPEE